MRGTAFAAALLLAPLFAPARAEAQFSGTGPSAHLVTYFLSGCDYSNADLFGPGPRACATGYLTYDATPSAYTYFELYNVRIVGVTGWAFDVGHGGYENPIVPGGGTDNDGGYPSRCEISVCRGVFDQRLAANGVFFSSTGAQPTSAFLNVRYFGDDVATGTPVDPNPLPLSCREHRPNRDTRSRTRDTRAHVWWPRGTQRRRVAAPTCVAVEYYATRLTPECRQGD